LRKPTNVNCQQHIARSFAREGATVIVNGRTEQSVEDAIAELRQELPEAQLLPLAADNGTPEGSAQTITKYPDVDVLVNNLGIYANHDVFALSNADWQRMFDVNIQSGVRLSRHYLPGMHPVHF
jgi:3-oxoacyl-[acyl-carrier protein] reductase